jgi:hypothetical protein
MRPAWPSIPPGRRGDPVHSRDQQPVNVNAAGDIAGHAGAAARLPSMSHNWWF